MGFVCVCWGGGVGCVGGTSFLSLVGNIHLLFSKFAISLPVVAVNQSLGNFNTLFTYKEVMPMGLWDAGEEPRVIHYACCPNGGLRWFRSVSPDVSKPS